MQDIIPQDDRPRKQCTKCNRILTIDCFSKKKRGLYGVSSWCKQCFKDYELLRKAIKVEPPLTLICEGCGKCQPSEYFGKNSQSPNGLYAKCKECMNEYNRQSRRYRIDTNPDVLVHARMMKARWCKDHRERLAFLRRCRPLTEREKAYKRQYYKTHAEYFRNSYLRWRASKYSAWKKQYSQREDVKQRSRINNHNRRARFHAAPGKYTEQDIQRKMRAQKHRCYYCHKPLKQYHIDHVVPLSKGGSNWPDNLVLACPPCNQRKQARSPHEWPEGGRLL